MARFSGYVPCPDCRKRGADRTGDNLGTWSDGSAHCFSCGYHVGTPLRAKLFKEEKIEDDIPKAVLPRDFTREVPAEGIKWIVQYGLPWSYWKKYCGYTPKENRLVITFGDPILFSQGRALTVGDRKWRFYGDGHGHVQTLGHELPGEVVLVEDIISAHKVAHQAPCICLFGTNIHDLAVKELQRLKRPVRLWLDADQYPLLPKKINKLQSLLSHPVRYIHTEKDPKLHTMEEIKELTR